MKKKIFDNSSYYIAVFNSKNHAIQLYYILEKKGYRKFQLISTPCQVKGGCSYSIKFNNLSDLKYLEKEALKFNKFMVQVYLVKRIEGKKVIKKLDNII